jgi:outer membrane protein TolC
MRRWIATVAAAALIVPSSLVPVHAQPASEGVQMSLAQALRTALQNNLDLVIARKDPQIAEQGIEAAMGPLDPRISASVDLQDTQTDGTVVTGDPSTPLDPNDTVTLPTASDEQAWSATAEFAHLLDFGGEYTLAGSYADSNSNDVRTQFDRVGQDIIYYPTTTAFDSTRPGLEFRYTMPLLRGLGREVVTSDVLLAKSGLEISRNDLRLQATTTIKDVEDAYWDLVAVRAALNVANQSLKLANDLLELNKKKVEVGTLAPIEITQAEAGVAAREEGVIQAENALEAAEDRLLQLLAVPQTDPMWSTSIIPTDRPMEPGTSPGLDEVMGKALEIRPELLTARQAVKDRELSERVAQNGTKHGLDLVSSVAISKPESDTVLSVVGSTDPARNIVDYDGGPDWRVGLVYSYPLHNRTAKAAAKTATLNREKAELGLQNTEQAIRVDVRNAVRNVESGVKRVKAAQSSTILQQKKLEAEQKKFDNGMSTSFEVLTFQTDLADAQVAEIRARLDYVKALADLERAQGTLLEARGLKLE